MHFNSAHAHAEPWHGTLLLRLSARGQGPSTTDE